MTQKFILHWEKSNGETYLYGSDVNFSKEGYVQFKNMFFPSGTKIHTWRSKTDYQSSRSNVQLPLLTKGRRYKIKIDAVVHPVHSVYIQIQFYNRFKENIGQVNIKSKEYEFIYPETAYFYDISLINAGLDYLKFYSLSIEHAEFSDMVQFEGEGIVISSLMSANEKSTALNIIFREPEFNSVAFLPDQAIKKLGNVIEIQSYRIANDIYSSSEVSKIVLSKISQIYQQSGLEEINWIGHGKVSNNAILFYADRNSFNSKYFLIVRQGEPLIMKEHAIQQKIKIESFETIQRDNILPLDSDYNLMKWINIRENKEVY